MAPWSPFSGFELADTTGKRVRLAAAEVAARLEIVIDDDQRCEPQRWRLTEKGMQMFSAANINMLVTLGYARQVD